MPQDKVPIRIVIFDLGRVLIRICEGWQHACQCAGVRVAFDKIDPAADRMLHDLACKHDVGAIDVHAFARAAAPILHISTDQFLAISHGYLRGVYPGGAALIEELRASGVATACLSNTNEQHWRLMNDPAEIAHFPLHRLDHRFASHLIGARKPDAPIYAHVEAKTGLAPAKILFFDDVAENIAAAAARGWNAHQVHPKSPDPVAQMRGVLVEAGVL